MKPQTKKTALVIQVDDQLSLNNAQFLAHEGFNVAVTAANQAILSKSVEIIGHGAVGFLNESTIIGELFTIYQKVTCYFGGKINLLLLNNINFSIEEITDFSEAYFSIQFALPYLDGEAIIMLNTGRLTKERLSNITDERKKHLGINETPKCELAKPSTPTFINDIQFRGNRS